MIYLKKILTRGSKLIHSTIFSHLWPIQIRIPTATNRRAVPKTTARITTKQTTKIYIRNGFSSGFTNCLKRPRICIQESHFYYIIRFRKYFTFSFDFMTDDGAFQKHAPGNSANFAFFNTFYNCSL